MSDLGVPLAAAQEPSGAPNSLGTWPFPGFSKFSGKISVGRPSRNIFENLRRKGINMWPHISKVREYGLLIPVCEYDQSR